MVSTTARQKDDTTKRKRIKNDKTVKNLPQDHPTLHGLLMGGLVVTFVAWFIGGSSWAWSSAEGRCSFILRLVLMFAFEGVFSPLCALFWLLPARKLALILPGAQPDGLQPATTAWPTPDELQHNDDTIRWPRPEHIPTQWVKLARGRKQPFFLNHVRGSIRL